MDDELNDHLDSSQDTATSKSTPEDTINKSISPSSEEYNFNFSHKPATSCQPSYVSSHSNNDSAEDRNHYRYQSAVERRERVYQYKEEEVSSPYQFQQGTPNNYRGQNFVNDYSYFPTRERAHDNQGFDVYNNETTASSNFEGRIDEYQRQHFNDNQWQGMYEIFLFCIFISFQCIDLSISARMGIRPHILPS